MNTKIINTLISEMEKMPTIDAHEHLPFEHEIINKPADIFNRIFCHYSITNAISAGMSVSRDYLQNTNIPLSERWQAFKPYLPAIIDTGYAKAGLITAKELYGVGEINDDTYKVLSDRLQKNNKPGLFNDILKNKCKAEYVLNQNTWQDDFSVKVHGGLWDAATAQTVVEFDKFYNAWSSKLDDNFDDGASFAKGIVKWVADNKFVGFKYTANISTDFVEEKVGLSLYKQYKNRTISDNDINDLGRYIMHKTIEFAPMYNLVIAIHCGIIWDVWCDFRETNPLNMIPILMKYRDTRFDLYHGGIPWVREIAVMGNQYPNAYLNLVWCHQISPFMTQQMLNEWIDLVPVNKIIGFAGDNVDGPEKTYGVYKMTLENIAIALSIRVDRKLMSIERAVDICRMWLYENPKKIYNLK